MTPAKDYTRPCDYEEYYLNGDKPYLTTNPNKLTNNDRPMATVEVQGTSSAAYGVAAFNIRTDFGDAPLYDKDKISLKDVKFLKLQFQ